PGARDHDLGGHTGVSQRLHHFVLNLPTLLREGPERIVGPARGVALASVRVAPQEQQHRPSLRQAQRRRASPRAMSPTKLSSVATIAALLSVWWFTSSAKVTRRPSARSR